MAFLLATVTAAGAAPGPAAAPRLTTPREGAVTHLTLPFFSWEDAAAYPFPGEYQVQIASDRDFAQPVVEADDGRTVASYPFYYDKYWQHAAVVFDRGRLQFYLNGYRVAEAEGESRTLPPLRLVGIGAGYGRNGARENFFKGMLDDVRVYGTALPTGDILAQP